MLNREKYAKEIIDIAIKGKSFAVVNGKPTVENTTSCRQCDFKHIYGCTEARERWANSEYVEPQADWSKVPVDTPILVRDNEKVAWKKDILQNTRTESYTHGDMEQHHGARTVVTI